MMYSERLIFLREDNNLTQQNIADMLNISRGSYSLYELEYTIMPLKHLITICNFFNISLDYMFSFSDIPNYKKIVNEVNLSIAGTRLKSFRKELKLTQKDLAKNLKVANTIISEYEKGNFLMSTHSLYSICKTYKISADYLLGRIEKPMYLK